MKDLIGMLPSAVPNITLKLVFTLNFFVILKSVANPVRNVRSLLLLCIPLFKEIPHGADIMNRSGVTVLRPIFMGYMAKLIMEGDILTSPP
jgi:hypothetical protein